MINAKNYLLKTIKTVKKQIELINEINYSGKINADVNKLKENQKEFLKHNIFTLNSQQGFKSEAQNVLLKKLINLH